ncbi:MAG TPA: polysaccharide pyruvyl transferase family protein [Patescibacteria group bacterium]|nr:polysaccharide pyruvyl transferase family protein [Patescibacteria group bacterium]
MNKKNNIDKRKKIGIITLDGYKNYGNRLQAYAVKKILTNMNFNVKFIILKEDKKKINRFTYIKNKIIKLPHNFINYTKKIFIYFFNLTVFRKRKKLINKRIKKIKGFSLKYLPEDSYNDNFKELEEMSNNYDFFITGSDQVWNPTLKHRAINKHYFYFLKFADINKRISFVSSFGVSNIPDEYINLYKKALSEITNISVREEAGKNIVKKLTNKDVPVLLDPTLLITKEHWLSISKEHQKKPKKYILTYFLGKLSNKDKNYIKNIAKENDLKIVNLCKIKNKHSYNTSPEEFIDYINSAKLVFTDSFHGAAFSILMKTPFVAFKRILENKKCMFSRIDNLLKKFHMENRYIKNIDKKNIFNIDFSEIENILKKERKKGLDYLNKATKN